MEFNFEKEMNLGKKHLNVLNFDEKKYDLSLLVEELFSTELSEIHKTANRNYEIPKELGKDTHTEFHKKFYNKLDSGWEEFQMKYNSLIKEVILPYLGLEEAMVQRFPNLRVQLPNNLAVIIKHYDSDENHKHPFGEINFIYALTDMFDTNTVLVETLPRSERFQRINLKKSQCISFNGNLCSHYNEINKTGKTRVSFDFRVLPLNYYSENYEKLSVTKNIKYREGGYYSRFTSKKIFQGKDIWDKEKEKFNGVMTKYGVKDAWGIVDLFERKVAEYSGSKFGVSVDNCTNALFLCIKWLKYKGEITIPSKTYCSVPCTIINAGCKVKFEDIPWSGAYRLKPLPLYDGAVRFNRGMYQKDTFHCLSFHIRKHLPIGKGGMILCDDEEAYKWFRTARYEGRHIADGVSYKEDILEDIGWNMYMTPEQAARGLELLEKMKDVNPDQESSGTCKDLSQFECYTSN